MGPAVGFLLLDGLRRPQPSGPSEVVLCALGLAREGTPHPLALRVVPKEDERTWRALLGDLKADGIGSDLLLICSDGPPPPPPVGTAPLPPGAPLEPLVDRPEPVVFSTPEPAREPEAVVLHVSHLREAEAVVLHVPPAPAPEPGDVGPRMLDLASDEAFEEWLQVYRRQAVRMKVVLAFTSAAGLITGLVLSLR